MPELDRPQTCEYAEYQSAFQNRLREGSVDQGEILTMYMKLMGIEAVKFPVRVDRIVVRLGRLCVDIIPVDDDLQPGSKKFLGILSEGVWNAATEDQRILIPYGSSGRVEAHDGVFREYDDGMDEEFHAQELVGANVSLSTAPADISRRI